MRRMPRLSPLTSVAAASLVVLQLASWQASRAQTCNVRVEIETPADGATVDPRQTISGWAVDLGATSGTGIDAVVASLDGALDSPDNRLVGVAEYGGARGDIAATLGEDRFTNSGYTFDWDTTTAPGGSHPLFLQAHSACGWHSASRTVVIPGAAGATGATSASAATPTRSTSSIIVAGGTATPASGAVAATPLASVTPSGAGGAPTGAALVVTPGALPPPPTSTALQPPSNLRIAGTTSTGVTLSWDPAPGTPPSGYLIYESAVTPTGGNAPPVVVARVPGTATAVTLSGLQDPTRYTYFFTVASLGADGSASPYLLTTVSTTAPSTRVPVPPTPVGGTTAAAAAAVPGAFTATPTRIAGAATPGPATVAATPAASGAASGSGQFTTSVSPAGAGAVSIAWSAQAGATAYNVYGASMMAPPAGQTPLVGGTPNPLASAAPGTWVAVGSNVTGTSTTVSGLTPGGMYEFLVRAVNATGGEFSQSSPQPITLAATTTAPTAAAASSSTTPPTTSATSPAVSTPALPPATSPASFTLTVTPATNTSLSLAWNPYVGATSYGVLVSRPPGGQFVADSSRAALTTTSTVIDGLTPGSQFTFMIAAKDATGKELARTNQVPVTVGQPAAPGPLGTGPFPQATVVATPVLVPTPSLAGAVPGAVPGTVPGAAPATPGLAGTASLQLTSNASDPGTANLQWNPVPGAASYSVWSAGPGGQWQVVLPSTQNAAAYIPNLTPGQMGFMVRARDANGTDIAQSNPVTVTITPR